MLPPDLNLLTGALTSLKAASDIAKAMIGLRDATAIQGQVFELQRVILEAQSNALTAKQAQSDLIDLVRDLEAEMARLKSWEAEKQRYQLTEIRPGALAYSLKEKADPSEPEHLLCANCHGRGEKSVLQRELRNPGRLDVYFCQNCGADIIISGARFGNPPGATRRR